MPSAPPAQDDGGTVRRLPAVGAAVSLIVIFVVALSIPLSVASSLGLTGAEITGWIVALYGVSGLLTIVLVARYRQPLVVTGNIFVLIFIASLGADLPWPELVGATTIAGAVVLVLGWTGLTDRLTRWVPAPIVFGLLAGAVTPYVVEMFTALGTAPVLIGGTLLAYVLGRLLLEPRVPAILAALVAGIVLAAIVDGYGSVDGFAPPWVAFTAPEVSVRAVITATPVFVILITLQANVPSLVFLRAEGYRPPERTVDAVSGLGTSLGSLLGPMGVSLSLPATALTAGPGAGPRRSRHLAAYLAGGAAVVIATLAGMAAELEAIVPAALLTVLVGLAVLGVLMHALREIAGSDLVLGPVLAFVIALSDLTLLGLGRFFWALVIGLGVSLLVERDAWPDVTPHPRSAG